jgi:hypothetical protein
MADDVVRLMYDHFEAGKEKAKKGIDLFIHSNGGRAPSRGASLALSRNTQKSLLR